MVSSIAKLHPGETPVNTHPHPQNREFHPANPTPNRVLSAVWPAFPAFLTAFLTLS